MTRFEQNQASYSWPAAKPASQAYEPDKANTKTPRAAYRTFGALLRIHFRLLASDKNRNDENGAGDDAGEQDKYDSCGENGWCVRF